MATLKQAFALILLSSFAICSRAAGQSIASHVVSDNDGEAIATAYREGFAAFRRRDFSGAVTVFKKAYEINPKDDVTVYFLAAAYAMGGDQVRAVEWLSKLAELRTCFSPSPTTFSGIAHTDEYKAVLRRIEANRPFVHNSSLAFTVPERDLIPEGIGYDPVERVFYLSSLRKRKIVKINPDSNGRQPKIEDFTTEAQDGLYCVLGIKIDAKRRVLWAISSAEPFMKDYSTGDDGKAALFAYDLRTRKLIKKFVPQTEGPHLLNDLVLDESGNVFLTDSRSSEIFRVPVNTDELQILLPKGTLDVPNGVSISDDGRVLFIASIPMGVYHFDLKTKRLGRLAYPQGISLAGIDGLYFYKNSLIGVLNMINGGRVARFYLNSSLDLVTRTEIIECNNPLFDDPTTGAIAENSFYYIANSQYESAFDVQGSILPLDKIHEVVVLKVKL